ncbi:MAG: ATP-binding protein, partial [Candidatus Limnocylindrales bacterium]
MERSTSGSEQLFAAWRTFFERLAASAPVVMIFEDHHFADAGLLDFVDHLLEWSRAVPIYVVTLARPELLERRPNWGAGKRNFTSLYLEPLPEAAMRELLAGLVPGLPETAARDFVARADGVPLYAVETVRMLVAQGRLAPDADGVYRPTGDLTSLAVPETLTALIASRLDGLAPEERALVADAAVLGQSFTPAGLAAVSGIPAAELETRLRALVRRELLVLEADPRSPERGQYAFVQALVREVAYNTLARADRKTRHLAAARFFEALGSDELAGALAGHHLAAQQNATEGPEADALAAQARIALRGAAERAAALGSHDQAVTFLEQALTVTTDPAEQAELLERAGESASAAAHHDQAEAFLRQAVDRQRERGDRPATARTIAALGRTLLSGRQVSEGLALLEAAASEFADLGADPARIRLEGQLARAYYLHEEFGRAAEVAERVDDAAEHGDLLDILADTLVTRGSALGQMGRLREGVGTIEIGERIAREIDLSDTLMRALNNRSVSQSETDPLAALAATRDGLALARRLGHRRWMLSFSGNVGNNAMITGDWDGALAVLDEALASDPDAADGALLLDNAISVRVLRGESVEAEINKLEGMVAGSADPGMHGYVDDVRATAAFVAGRLAEAREACLRMAERALTFRPFAFYLRARAALWLGDAALARADLAGLEASDIHGPSAAARRATVRAGLGALEGQADAALAGYRDALRRWADLGLVWDQALCTIDMATLLDPATPEVATAIESGREILMRLAARPFLERLEAA